MSKETLSVSVQKDVEYHSSNGSCFNCFMCNRSYLKNNKLQCLVNKHFVNEVFSNTIQ